MNSYDAYILEQMARQQRAAMNAQQNNQLGLNGMGQLGLAQMGLGLNGGGLANAIQNQYRQPVPHTPNRKVLLLCD